MTCAFFSDQIFIDEFEVKEVPSVKFTKTIAAVNGNPVTPSSPLFVFPGQTVTYKITAEAMSGYASTLAFQDRITNTSLTGFQSISGPGSYSISNSSGTLQDILTITGPLTPNYPSEWYFTATVKPGTQGTAIRNCISNIVLKDLDDDPGVVHASSKLCADIPVVSCPTYATATAGNNVTICQGSSTQLQATGNGTYSWSPTTGLDDPSSANPVANPLETTTYTVTVTTVHGCTSSASVTVNVVKNCISVGHDVVVTENGDPFYISGASPAGGEWSGPGIINPNTGLFDSPASSGFGPGIYPVTYTVTNSCGTLSATVNVIVVEDDGSGPSYNFVCNKKYDLGPNSNFPDTEIGRPGTETVIDANDYGGTVMFDGVYNVVGSLRLINGTFEMTPGTIFYVNARSHVPDCPVEEYLHDDATYILVDGARLNMEGAAMRGTCEMWGGVVLANRGSIKTTSAPHPLNAGGTNCVYLKSEISDAFVGLNASSSFENGCLESYGISNENEYYVYNTNFLNNYIGIVDGEKETAVPGEGVTYSHFQTYPAQMKAPLDSVDINEKWYGYQGMKLRGWDLTGIAFEYNTFDNLCEGINVEGTKLTIKNNTFTRNYQYGIRAYGHIASAVGSAPDEIVLENNSIVVPSAFISTNHQLNPFSPVVGIFTTDSDVDLKLIRNKITGSDPDPTSTAKIQYGIYNEIGHINSQTLITDNDIRHQDIGIRLFYPVNSNKAPIYRHNYLGSNDVAIGVARNLHTNANAKITCNTIEMPSFALANKGIMIEPDAWLNNLGTFPEPNGNKFVNINEGMINDGSNAGFTYFRYYSSEETWVYPGVAGFPGGGLTANPNLVAIGACGAGNTGVNSNRVQGTTYAAILEMMDSLQYQVGTPADLMHYQAKILDYHQQHNLLGSLQQYMNMLPGQNLDAYNFFALALMEHYRREHQEAQAQSLRSDLLAYNPLNNEIKFRVKYFDVMGRLGNYTTPKGYKFTVGDSLDLSDISWSNTSHSEIACVYLRFYRPKAACGSTSTNAQSRVANETKPKAVKGSLGQSYPNPAALEATIPYEVNPGVKEAELRIYEIATGRIIQIVRLDVKAQGINLDLKPIRQGVYSYTLVEDGMPTATKKMVVLK